MFNRIAVLKTKGYIPDTILDIGAYHGHWTNDCKNIYPDAKYCLFEAINYQELNRYQNDTNVKVFNAILNDKQEEVNWYEMQNTGDSIFREKTHHFENCNILKRQTNTLNNVLSEHPDIMTNAKHILIKIDCQGAEIPILKGSSEILTKTDFIILEIPLFGQYNEGVPNFLEHIKYMDEIGYIPFDITDNHYVGGFNIQIDMMFINKNHHFNQDVQKFYRQ